MVQEGAGGHQNMETARNKRAGDTHRPRDDEDPGPAAE